MAHEFAMKLVGNPTTPLKDMNSIIEASWKYADAMQAEADKRLKPSNSMELEWQPDWSQAPEWSNYWFMDEENIFWWSERQPYFLATKVSKVVANNSNDISQSFDYQGDWRKSLRKRPE